jgi:hypothetical protein
LNFDHRSVRVFSRSNSTLCTTGTAFCVEQQTGSPPLRGAHLRPQSKRDTGALKPS